MSINMINNIFQGIYKRSVVEIWNVKNVLLKQNYFKNLQMIKSDVYDAKFFIGIVCNNSDIYDSSFNNVSLRTSINLDHSSVNMDNISFFENSLTFNYAYSAITMDKSKGSFSNMIFADNYRCDFVSVSNGELLAQNLTFSGNSFTPCRNIKKFGHLRFFKSFSHSK